MSAIALYGLLILIICSLAYRQLPAANLWFGQAFFEGINYTALLQQLVLLDDHILIERYPA